MEGGAATLYVYEIQLAPAVRRQGLGKFMMLAVELAARAGGLGRVMLTVQDGNAGAARLYERLGYGTDPTSPGPGEGPGGGDPGYRIMSKGLIADGRVAVVSGERTREVALVASRPWKATELIAERQVSPSSGMRPTTASAHALGEWDSTAKR